MTLLGFRELRNDREIHIRLKDTIYRCRRHSLGNTAGTVLTSLDTFQPIDYRKTFEILVWKESVVQRKIAKCC